MGGMSRSALRRESRALVSDFQFSGKDVLVIGGSSGIGNGVAQAFRQRGANVCVWGTRRNADDYVGVDGANLSGLHYSCVDVAQPHQIESAAVPFAALDVLVLSQGTVVYQRGEFQREGWDKVMAVNLDSLLHCCNRFRKQLSERSGAIVIVSSVSAFQANKGNPAYAASKAGAVSLTRTLGQAWADECIRVNGVAPGLVATKLTKVTTDNPARRAAALAAIPAARLGTPEDIAGAVLFLASPLASYIYGQTLTVDGGYTL
jgi:3-oxoacyl-[acyl-carrier protein] reductase